MTKEQKETVYSCLDSWKDAKEAKKRFSETMKENVETVAKEVLSEDPEDKAAISFTVPSILACTSYLIFVSSDW